MPIRTCVVCRKREDKGEVLRFVRSPEATALLDLLFLLPGRGTYVHQTCLMQKGAAGKLTGRLLDRSSSKVVKQVSNAVFLGAVLEQAKMQLAHCKDVKRKKLAMKRLEALERLEKDKFEPVKETKIRL